MQRPRSNAVTVFLIKENLRLKASAISFSKGKQKVGIPRLNKERKLSKKKLGPVDRLIKSDVVKCFIDHVLLISVLKSYFDLGEAFCDLIFSVEVQS